MELYLATYNGYIFIMDLATSCTVRFFSCVDIVDKTPSVLVKELESKFDFSGYLR